MPSLAVPVEGVARVPTISHRPPYWGQAIVPQGGGADCCTMALGRAGLLPRVGVTVPSFREAEREPLGPGYFMVSLVLPL
jgi:hypothetical protein